jgi:hypothetical protein
MTIGRHVPMTLLVVLVVALLVAFGACIVLLNPGRERPADVTPTPGYTPTVIVEPTRPVAVPPTNPPPTVPTPERLLLTPHVIPAPTRTPATTMTSTPVPPTPDRPPIQRG